jgi:hypothetical protein
MKKEAGVAAIEMSWLMKPGERRKSHIRKAARKKNRKEKAAMAAGAENNHMAAEEWKTVMTVAAEERKAATTAATKQRLKGVEEKIAPMAAQPLKKRKLKESCWQLLQPGVRFLLHCKSWN